MPTSSNRGYQTPPGGTEPNVPYWMQALADQLDVDVQNLIDALANIKWATISGKPSTFPPSSHTHSLSAITGKPVGWDRGIYISTSSPPNSTGKNYDIWIEY